MFRKFDLILAFFALALVIALAGCAPASEPPQPETSPTPAQESSPSLRIINQGQNDLEGLVVIFPDSRIEFGDVPAGATTEYLPAPAGVYNYAAYEYTLDGQRVTQPVIDWVGESPRPGSRFTYVLDFDPARQQMLAVELVEVQIEE